MPYSNIPGVRASYLDGAFSVPNLSTQPNILIVGPATGGRTDERWNVVAISNAEKEFGAATPLLRVAHEVLAQGADNIALIRSGGKQGSWVFTDSAGATLTITPEYRDDEVLARYALFLENDGSDNRIMIYDLTDQTWVYDSSEILVINSGVVDVVDTGIDLFTSTTNLKATPDIAEALSTMDDTDFTADGTATAVSGVPTAGTDGNSPTLVERYAALNTSLHMLDFKDADIVIPVDTYLDDDNVVDDTEHSRDPSGATTDTGKYGFFWKGVPVAGGALDKLGYVWQYVYRGKLYTYFADTDDHFDAAPAAAAATATFSGDITLTATKNGKGGNAITYQVDTTGAPGPTVTVTETDYGFDVLITDDGTASTADTVTAITAALTAKTLANGVTALSLVTASGGSVALLSAVGDVAKTNLTGGVGGSVLTHNDLTGDTIPSAVSTRWGTAVNAELREVNFGHQLATFCHQASVNWSTMLGVIGFKAPTSFSRSAVADWVGQLPEYTDQGTFEYIDAPADNGVGILGFKLLAGESKTSDGYRSSLVTGGDSTDGYAGGGFILTQGAALPNGAKWPYGISSADEALDSGGKPIDIGKHLFSVYDWPIHSNGYNGGSTYRGSAVGTFAGKISVLPANEEPIGLNGRVTKVQSPPRIHSSQLSDLASIRAIGLREEDGFGLIFTSAKTSANPDSDFVRLSTIRSVNQMLTGIRRIAKPYIGKEFTTQRLLSLQTAIDGFIVNEFNAKTHQGAKARIEYTRADKIAGRLTIKLRMVPPFSIDTITVETSLAADETEL